MGEPAGVGGEVLLKAWANHRHRLPPFFVIDSIDRLSKIAGQMGLDVPLYKQASHNVSMPVYTDHLHVVDTPLMQTPVPGQLNLENATSVVNSITKAVEMTMSGLAAGVVTNPIHKSALYEAGFAYPGHPELLASLST